MPVYKCPKCGRIVEKPTGRYYCRVCGASLVESNLTELFPPTGYRYGWIDEVYVKWCEATGNPVYDPNSYVKFYYNVIEPLRKSGEVEFGLAGGTLRERLARQRGMLKVQRVMDVAHKTQILPRGGFAFWMYRR
ncbi:MAG: hypothetical protein QXH20_04270 [Candidatus Bathyarchaeia archaeon]